MPRANFSSAALRGATPGLSRLAQALTSNQGYQQGYDQELQNQTRMAQAVAGIERDRAAVEKLGADTQKTRQEVDILGKRPNLYEEQVALSAGADIPLVQSIRKMIQTGQAPQMPMGPETADGQMGSASMQIDPAIKSKVAQALQQFLPLMTNTGDLNPEQMADAASKFRDMGLGDQILAGTMDRNKVGGAQAAVAGKPLFDAGADGGVLDQYGGQLDASNPLAQSTLGLRTAQTGAQRANAAQSYAAAEASRASAGKYRAETGEIQAGMGGGGRAPSGYSWQADGTLKPIPGGPADVANKTGAPSEGERKAATLLSRLQFSEQQLENALKDADSAAKPGIAQTVIRGLPLVGEPLATTMTGSNRQRVEAAQLDILDAALTLGTGAAYTKEQLQGYAQSYFPQIGNDAATIRDKQERLKNLIESARISAGRATPTNNVPSTSAAPAPVIPAPQQAAPIPVTSDADYAALPPGTRFVTPDGKTGTKR